MSIMGNMLSTKPEVDKCIALTSWNATGNMYRKFREVWTMFLRYASGQTDKPTDIHIDRQSVSQSH